VATGKRRERNRTRLMCRQRECGATGRGGGEGEERGIRCRRWSIFAWVGRSTATTFLRNPPHPPPTPAYSTPLFLSLSLSLSLFLSFSNFSLSLFLCLYVFRSAFLCSSTLRRPRLNVTGKLLPEKRCAHTRAANRGTHRRNYIDISIVWSDKLIN